MQYLTTIDNIIIYFDNSLPENICNIQINNKWIEVIEKSIENRCVKYKDINMVIGFTDQVLFYEKLFKEFS